MALLLTNNGLLDPAQPYPPWNQMKSIFWFSICFSRRLLSCLGMAMIFAPNLLGTHAFRHTLLKLLRQSNRGEVEGVVHLPAKLNEQSLLSKRRKTRGSRPRRGKTWAVLHNIKSN